MRGIKKSVGALSVILTAGVFTLEAVNAQEVVRVAVNDKQNAGSASLRLESIPGKADGLKSKGNTVIASDPGMKKMISQAQEMLVERLRIKTANIEVVEAQYVTWRDSSIGCPKAGSQYLQAITNGVRIRLRAENRLHNYHSGGNRPLFYCAKPSKNNPLPYEYGEI